MLRAGGIDLGGTKIEAQVFDADWGVLDKRRVATPHSYDALVEAVADQVAWMRRDAPDLPVGIAAAGLANPQTGTWIAANLSANGQPFPRDVAAVAGPGLVWLNDCRAFTLAEAVFAGEGLRGTMVGLLLGTGIAGGVAVDGTLAQQGTGQAGEFGHMPISGAVLSRYALPVIQCGCGRWGCVETYGSGPGMERLALHLTGEALSTRHIVSRRDDPKIKPVWDAWCEINASMILTIMTVVDPDTIILGGGMSQVPGLIGELQDRLRPLAWGSLPLPDIRLGTRGETAAALGAAYAAYHV